MKSFIASIFASLMICQSAYSQSNLAAAASKNDSHCSSEEVTYFNCKVKASSKVASVCGKGYTNAKGKAGYLQYRFGKVGKVELAFPNPIETDAITDQFYFVNEGISSPLLIEVKLSFISSGYVYQLNHVTEELPDGKESEISSIYVAKVGDVKPRSVLMCVNTDAGEGLGKLYFVVPLMSSPGGKWYRSFL